MTPSADQPWPSLKSLLLLYVPLIVVFGAIAGVVGNAAAKRDIPVFEANATVLFRFGVEYMPTNPAFETWQGDPIRLLNDDAVQTEIQVLGSRRVLEDALASLSRDSGVPNIAEASKVLSIRRIQGTNVARVSYRSPDPELASEIVDRLLAAYFAVRTDLLEREAGAALAAVSQELREQWIEAEERLASYERDAAANEVNVLGDAGGDLSVDWQIQRLVLETEVQNARQLYEEASRIADRNRLA
jgi:polysaccharide biosynthesis transport protein